MLAMRISFHFCLFVCVSCFVFYVILYLAGSVRHCDNLVGVGGMVASFSLFVKFVLSAIFVYSSSC